MITDTIKKQIIDAMKSKDELRVSTLKLLSSALHNEVIKKQADLTNEEEIEIVRKEAKKRKDAIDIYEKVSAKDRADKEKKELEILREFLPADLSEEILARMVDDAKDLSVQQAGFSYPPDGKIDLGEIVICFPVALEEAKKEGKRINTKIEELMLHAALHLLGIHHE